MGRADNRRTASCLPGALFAALALSGCSEGPRVFDFGSFDLPAGGEIYDLCVSASFDNTEPLFVTAVELDAAAGFHHSNWFYVPTDRFRGPDGVWPCSSRDYSE